MTNNYEAPKGYDEVQEGVRYSEIQVIEYPSKTTGTNRKANLLLPLDYTPEKKYPVLYLLHGIFGNEYSFTNDPNMKIELITGNLIASGEAVDMIVVFPDMFAKTRADHEPGFNVESYLAYDNFINDWENDLIPFIESTYSTAFKGNCSFSDFCGIS